MKVDYEYQHKTQLKFINFIPNQLIIMDYREEYGIKCAE